MVAGGLGAVVGVDVGGHTVEQAQRLVGPTGSAQHFGQTRSRPEADVAGVITLGLDRLTQQELGFGMLFAGQQVMRQVGAGDQRGVLVTQGLEHVDHRAQQSYGTVDLAPGGQHPGCLLVTVGDQSHIVVGLCGLARLPQ